VRLAGDEHHLVRVGADEDPFVEAEVRARVDADAVPEAEVADVRDLERLHLHRLGRGLRERDELGRVADAVGRQQRAVGAALEDVEDDPRLLEVVHERDDPAIRLVGGRKDDLQRDLRLVLQVDDGPRGLRRARAGDVQRRLVVDAYEGADLRVPRRGAVGAAAEVAGVEEQDAGGAGHRVHGGVRGAGGHDAHAADARGQGAQELGVVGQQAVRADVDGFLGDGYGVRGVAEIDPRPLWTTTPSAPLRPTASMNGVVERHEEQRARPAAHPRLVVRGRPVHEPVETQTLARFHDATSASC
jgi:hypothetical protein